MSTYRQPHILRKRAFTLIELLVVIAIISILAGILFPVFATSREKARQTSCASNMRQLGLAFEQYIQDNDEHYPPGNEHPYSLSVFCYGWAGQIFPYVDSTGVFTCPDDPTVPATRIVGGKSYTLTPVSYAYNGAIGATMDNDSSGFGYGIGGALSKMNAPAKTVLLVEVGSYSVEPNLADLSTTTETGANGTYSAGYNLLDASAYYYDLPLATGYIGGAGRARFDNANNYLSPLGRHSYGSNYLLADGHVKWLNGSSVSTGATIVGNYFLTSCDTTENQAQDGACPNTPAGTGNQSWAATFSPI